MQLLVLLTLLAVLPGMLLAVTGFTRILIVLGFLRTAIGTPTIPPNQVLVGIALFLSLFVMAPTLNGRSKTSPSSPTWPTRSRGDGDRARPRAGPEFMFKQTRDSDLALFIKLAAASARRRAPTCRPTS